MQQLVKLNGRLVSVNVSEAALNHLRNMTEPLLVEAELYFSCLIKKVCHFNEAEELDEAVMIMEGLYLQFRASMTSKCAIGDFDKDNTADFPIVNQQPYIPKWVNIDFRGNQWAGEFGYAKNLKLISSKSHQATKAN